MSTPGRETMYNKAQLDEMAASVGYWWHSIDLGRGVVTDGFKTQETLKDELELLRLPDLRDKMVLDIGAWDGFFSFEAEKRGANVSWRSIITSGQSTSLRQTPSEGTANKTCAKARSRRRPQDTPNWQPDKLPGKRGYDTAHKALDSKVETVVGDFMTMDLEPLGTFDVVFFLGVLYHMENPLASLRRVASLSNGVVIIETHAIVVPGYEHLELCEFYSSNQLGGDASIGGDPTSRHWRGCAAPPGSPALRF